MCWGGGGRWWQWKLPIAKNDFSSTRRIDTESPVGFCFHCFVFFFFFWQGLSLSLTGNSLAVPHVERDPSPAYTFFTLCCRSRPHHCHLASFQEPPPRAQHLVSAVHVIKSLSYTQAHSAVCCCCSVAKLCPTLCDPMDCSTPGSSVLHCLSELAQLHVH